MSSLPLLEFKLIVAGDRGYTDYSRISQTILAMTTVELQRYTVSIVSSVEMGPCKIAARYAADMQMTLYKFPTEWTKHGKLADKVCNRHMADFADGLLAFWNGRGKRTEHLILSMRDLGKPVKIVRY